MNTGLTHRFDRYFDDRLLMRNHRTSFQSPSTPVEQAKKGVKYHLNNEKGDFIFMGKNSKSYRFKSTTNGKMVDLPEGSSVK